MPFFLVNLHRSWSRSYSLGRSILSDFNYGFNIKRFTQIKSSFTVMQSICKKLLDALLVPAHHASCCFSLIKVFIPYPYINYFSCCISENNNLDPAFLDLPFVPHPITPVAYLHSRTIYSCNNVFCFCCKERIQLISSPADL